MAGRRSNNGAETRRRTVWLAVLGCCFVAGLCLAMGAMRGQDAVRTGPAADSVALASDVKDDSKQEPEQKKAQEEAQIAESTANKSLEAGEHVAARNDSSEEGLSIERTQQPDVPVIDANDNNASSEPVIMTSEGVMVDESSAIELFSMPAGADYVPNVVLVSVQKGTDTQDLIGRLSDEGVQTVDLNSLRWITDDTVEFDVLPESTVEEAVNELLATRGVEGAEPDYLYQITEDDEWGMEPDAALTDQEALGPEEPEPESTDAAEDEKLELVGESDSATVESADEANAAGEADAEDAADAADKTAQNDQAIEANDDLDSVSDVTVQDDAQGDAQGDETPPVNDPYYPWQWALQSMNVPQAWRRVGSSLTTVGVAMLDCGVDTDHEDLDEVIAPDGPYNAYRASTGVTDAAELADVKAGPSVLDHGTHVAGIIAAEQNNGVGIAGVANNVQLIPMRCYSYDTPAKAPASALVAAFQHAIDSRDEYNIRVINMSMGSKIDTLPQNSAVFKKIQEAFSQGIVTVTSAGNNGGGENEPSFINYPGDFSTCVSVMNLENTTVSLKYRTDDGGQQSLYNVIFSDAWSVRRYKTSNYNAAGETTKDISAPGTQIISLADEDKTRINGKNVPYYFNTGTSMAAPQVSGVLALMHGMVEVSKNADGAQLMVDALYSSARSLTNTPSVFDEETGYGEVDALEAINTIDSDHLIGPAYVHVGQEGITFSVETDENGVQSGWLFSTSAPGVLSIDENTGVCVAGNTGVAEVRATNGVKHLLRNVVVVGDIEGYDVVTTQGVAQYSVQSPTALSWEWSSSDEAVASVSNSGVLKAGNAVGKATITATLLVTKGSQHEITVSKDVLVVGPIAGPSAIWCGKTTSLAIQGPEGWTYTPEDFVWATADSKIATVDKYGVVTGVCGGETTIWAYPKDACSTTVGDDGLEHISSELSLSFLVSVRDKIDRDVIKASSIGTQTYTGKALTPSPKLSVGNKVLQEGVDYTLSYSNNVNAGTATVTISGAGAYAGSSRKQIFKIARASITDATVASISSKAYTGKAIEPKPKVTWNGATLKLGRDYTLSYKSNKKGPTAKVVVKGSGNFTGSKTVTFGIVTPTVAYRSYVHNVGWKTWSKDGASTGTSAKGKYVEGIKLKLTNKPYSGGIKYRVHVQDVGWQAWKANGAQAGVVGKSKRAEAVRIVLTGSMKSHYSVSYRVKIQGSGWTKWVKDGKTAGTTGKSLRITAVQIKLVPKA